MWRRRRSAARPLVALAVVLALAAALAGTASARAAVALAEIGPFSSYAAGHLPGGGYLVVWHDAPGDRLRLQRISPAGFPVGPSRVVLELSEGDSPAIGSVAVSADGSWAVFWTQPSGADQIGVGGAFFDAQDHLLGHVVYPDPIPDPGGGVVTSFSPVAVALPFGGYAVAFTVGSIDDPVGDPLRPTVTWAFLMRVDRAGNRVGDGVQVSEGAESFQGAGDLGLGAGRLVVLVGARPTDGATTAIRVRFYDLELHPLSAELSVADAIMPGQVFAAEVETGADGRFLVSWERVDTDGFHLLLRPFGLAGQPSGPAQELTEKPLAGSVELAVTEQGIAWVSWLEGEIPAGSPGPPVNRIVARPFDLGATPLGPPIEVDTLFGVPQEITGGVAGALVTWRPENHHPTLVGAVVGLATGAGAPPPELALTSPDMPGFRVWARFHSASGATRWGTAVEPCLVEALCVAGALPNRGELVVRVVGPRPNGFLWPILAPLTVSRVEVWIQQLDGGAVRYYVLPGSEPPSELLPGQFDRDGFLP
jgi:hypothetical protein